MNKISAAVVWFPAIQVARARVQDIQCPLARNVVAGILRACEMLRNVLHCSVVHRTVQRRYPAGILSYCRTPFPVSLFTWFAIQHRR